MSEVMTPEQAVLKVEMDARREEPLDLGDGNFTTKMGEVNYALQPSNEEYAKKTGGGRELFTGVARDEQGQDYPMLVLSEKKDGSHNQVIILLDLENLTEQIKHLEVREWSDD